MKKLPTLTTLVLAFLYSLTTQAVPKLNSLPEAQATIFLDFDGHYVTSGIWNGGNAIDCATADLSDAQITEVFNRVAEDYRPFQINITTDSAYFITAPVFNRIRVIITSTSSWYPQVGGVAWIGSFVWGDDTPAFVFSDRLGPNNAKFIAECCSHEAGHTIGLSHQSKYDGIDCTNPLELYNSGAGAGESSWAPLMGNGYGRNMTNWNNGPTQYGCNNVQDNLSIISSQNGIGYRLDDYSETLNASTTALTDGNFLQNGIINTNTDKDAFKLTLEQNTTVHITASPFSVGLNSDGANLDIKFEVYNAAGILINTYNPLNTMDIKVDTILNTGTYYFVISGTGNSNIGAYGSLGAYTFIGTSSALPIKEVILSGNILNNRHNLSWSILSDDPIESISIRTSTDGIGYTTLTSTAASQKIFSWQPFQNTITYYRLKVISAKGQTVYSNAIALKTIKNTANQFIVSTFVQNEITVNAAISYQYQLRDINGKIITNGNGISGYNHINISNQPNGIYLINIISNRTQQTKRIIKQ
jgi:hypothetical protein